jgi:hypothetical protein
LLQFSKAYSQEGKIKKKFNCIRAHCRFYTNPQCALKICNVPPGRKRNLWGALLQFCRGATYNCEDGFYAGAEFLAFPSLIGAFLNPDNFIG